MITAAGKCSSFGGPSDTGVGPQEGLALVELPDLRFWKWSHLFLPDGEYKPELGLARNLDPNALYCAMMWPKLGLSREGARNAMVRVVVAGGAYLWVQPVDEGPGDGSVVDGQQTQNTGRIIDLSPGALIALGVETDATLWVEVYP